MNARLDNEYIEDTPEEKILLDGSTAIYHRMVEELTNKTIANLTSRLALPSSVSVYKGNEENKEECCHLQIIVGTNLISQNRNHRIA